MPSRQIFFPEDQYARVVFINRELGKEATTENVKNTILLCVDLGLTALEEKLKKKGKQKLQGILSAENSVAKLLGLEELTQ